jgi:hypothetical protein
MAGIPSVAGHLSADQVVERIKGTVGFWRIQKWLVIYNLLVDPRPLMEVARHVGLAWQTVRNLVSRCNRFGPDVVEGPEKGGRRRACMTLEEEGEFIEPFLERAITVKVATAMEIKRKLEKHLGHTVHKTTARHHISFDHVCVSMKDHVLGAVPKKI